MNFPLGDILFIIIRNYGLVKLIDYTLSNKQDIGTRKIIKEKYFGENIIHLISVSLIEGLTNYAIINSGLITFTFNLNIIQFILYSFIFEIIFDFFHWITHWYFHKNKFLYKNFHSIHHRQKYPTAITTFYHHPLDYLVTNSLAQILTLILFPNISLWYFCLIINYFWLV
jgi:sterol desaturase/sphingolipid hydroxylase (fatty acid hydroxylase superfamily)